MAEQKRAAWPEGVGKHLLDRVDSTSAEALRLAATTAGPVWIMARQQEAGRGRRGRPWRDYPGNFAATLLIKPQMDAVAAARLSFVAALALHDALIDLCGPQLNIALKWPNDVLLNGGKLSGILLESSGSQGQVLTISIGIGVNLSSAPEPQAVEERALRPVSLKGETGLSLTQDDLLTPLAAAFDQRFSQLQSEGFAPIRAAWLARAFRLGETITARVGQHVRSGRFEGLDNSGALILQTDTGREIIPAADVYFNEVS